MFLVALCVSIFLDAIKRFFQPEKVSNPKLVFIVGCCGLVFNIMGLFLFHDHGHSHGGEEHVHEDSDRLKTAEEGQGDIQTKSGDEITERVADESGNVADVLPQTTVAGFPQSESLKRAAREDHKPFTESDETDSTMAPTLNVSATPHSPRKASFRDMSRSRRLGSQSSHSRFSSVDELHMHGASFRKDIIRQSRQSNLDDIESRTGSESGCEDAIEDNSSEPTERTTLLGSSQTNGSTQYSHHSKSIDKQDSNALHLNHKHNQEKPGGASHGHSHDLNMRGVFLHVIGDALGNIAVIASALIIWLTTWPFRYYADPVISLVITVIILGSAWPLCKAASRILLQAVPRHISVDEVRDDINSIPGIIACHHLHVWQLSANKFIASLHVQVGFDLKGEGSKRYMKIAKAINKCLHAYGIHSSTIQPEFCLDEQHRHTSAGTSAGSSDCEANGRGGVSKRSSKKGSKAPSLTKESEPDACLLECSDECGTRAQQCCAPTGKENEPGGHNH